MGLRLKKFVWATFQVEGTHNYPAAGLETALSDVEYLQHEHRHVFHFRVKVGVIHSDRDVEFIMLKEWCRQKVLTSYLSRGLFVYFGKMSCEMIAQDLLEEIYDKYDVDYIEIDCSEDGENGGTVVWESKLGS